MNSRRWVTSHPDFVDTPWGAKESFGCKQTRVVIIGCGILFESLDHHEQDPGAQPSGIVSWESKISIISVHADI